ncbi:cell division control protein 2 homolog 3 [Setaria italica]|nr:cell division control protein 2 homolog 3 [Setaria italica]
MDCGGAREPPLRPAPARPRREPAAVRGTVRAATWHLLTGAKRMHERRIIHRDIKPSNILVDDDRGARAPSTSATSGTPCPRTSRRRTSQPARCVTRRPEMLLGSLSPDYDERVDTWSLGCVMADLIKGGTRSRGSTRMASSARSSTYSACQTYGW